MDMMARYTFAPCMSQPNRSEMSRSYMLSVTLLYVLINVCSNIYGRRDGLRVSVLTPGRSHWAFSICAENSVIPVGNQMERAFPPEMFRKKGISLGYSSFLVFTKITGKSLLAVPFASSH